MNDSSRAFDDLLTFVCDVTNAEVVEVMLDAPDGDGSMIGRTGMSTPTHADLSSVSDTEPVVYTRDGTARMTCADWVGSLRAVAIGGPSGESGWLVAAHSEPTHFDDSVSDQLMSGARLVEHHLDRTLERNRADELGVDIRNYQDQLKLAHDQLEVSNRELEQFAYIAAHELLAPLRAVGMYAEVLSTFADSDAATGDQAVVCATAIRTGVDQMTEQVRYLLSLSQVQDNAAVLEDVDLGDVVLDALDSLVEPIAACGAEVSVGPLPVVSARQVPLQSVIANIIRNALRYQHKERVLMIDISSEPTASGSRVLFADNGSGIDPKDRARVFEMFERAADTAEGSGIGLALSRRILSVFDARIGIDDNDTGGVTFWIDFDQLGV